MDCVLTTELVRSFKPDPKVYQLAVDSLGFRPHEILMVACHKYHLEVARKLGLKGAFIARPLEFGPSGKVDVQPKRAFDFNVPSLIELTDALGA